MAGRGNLFDTADVALNEVIAKQQVAWRISGHAKFGEKYQVSTFRAGDADGGANLGAISIDVAYRWIDLCERDQHVSSLPVGSNRLYGRQCRRYPLP